MAEGGDEFCGDGGWKMNTGEEDHLSYCHKVHLAQSSAVKCKRQKGPHVRCTQEQSE